MSPPLPERYLPKSIRTNAQLLKGRSRVRVGDIFDISVKDTVEIQGLIEKQKTVISGHITLIDFLPPQ
jgi:hypothetical protein